MSGKRSRSRWFVLLILTGVGLGALMLFRWQPLAQAGDTGGEPERGEEQAGQVDLKAYRPNSTFLSEAEEENPGWYINVNWDDDDQDGWDPDDHSPGATYTPDKDDALISGNGCTEDDDLWKFTVEVVPSSIHGPIRLTFNEAKVKAYANRTKQNPFVSGNTVDFTGQPITLYLEGRAGSASFRDVELRGEYVGATPNVGPDRVLVTVFEVPLTGLFSGEQQEDCEVRHHDRGGSNDRNGKISYDDRDGNGLVDEGDDQCWRFRNCMETQGLTRPTGVGDTVTYDFKRQRRGKEWKIFEDTNWEITWNGSQAWEDDEQQDAEDNTPSESDFIYQIDGPGHGLLSPPPTHFFQTANFRDWVMVNLYGVPYQCSPPFRWHSQVYVKPREDDPDLLRRAGATTGETPGTEWAYQKLGEGWITVPDAPPGP